MCALLCCGPCFDTHYLSEDGLIYGWLDTLLTSKDDKVSAFARLNFQRKTRILCTLNTLYVYLICWRTEETDVRTHKLHFDCASYFLYIVFCRCNICGRCLKWSIWLTASVCNSLPFNWKCFAGHGKCVIPLLYVQVVMISMSFQFACSTVDDFASWVPAYGARGAQIFSICNRLLFFLYFHIIYF